MMAAQLTGNKIVVRRTIAATADELFDAWLDEESLGIWMCPPSPMGPTRTTAKIDARIGGTFEICMYRQTETIVHTGVYRRIDRPYQLVFTWVSPATEACESLVTVDFIALGKATEIVVTHERLPHDTSRQQHAEGWAQVLELLERTWASHAG